MTNNGRSSLEVEPESLLSLYSPGESRAAQRQALADDGTGGLTGLFKQYLEIAQSFRVALRQLCGDLVLRDQQVFQSFASVCIRRPIRHFARTAEKLSARSGREPIILLAGLNESQTCQIAELRQGVLLPRYG